MTFNVNQISKVSTGDTHISIPQDFNYKLSTDTVATIKASAYFNDYVEYLEIDDTIYLVGSDGSDLVKVTAVTPDVTVTSILATLPPASVTLAELSAGIAMSHIVKFAGEHTTVGGAATESITITGALVGDLAFAVLKTQGAGPQTILTAEVTAPDTLDVVFSADPSTDHVITYQLLRLAV